MQNAMQFFGADLLNKDYVVIPINRRQVPHIFFWKKYGNWSYSVKILLI
jgi:hypothetical protein